MASFRLLPWEYAVRNLLRRPSRSVLTLLALTTVVLLVLVVIGFLRGLEKSLAVSGDPLVVIVHSHGAAENLENSSVDAAVAPLFSASLASIQLRLGQRYVSPELYLGTNVRVADRDDSTLGLVRGVEPVVMLVRSRAQIVAGTWPGPGEVLVGRLAAAKLSIDQAALAIGQEVTFEGRSWRVSGHFAAAESALESELWCPLADLQQAMKRQDLSIVALKMKSPAALGDVELLCKERIDLELQAMPEPQYYASLQQHYRPVRMLAWLVVGLVSMAGVFAGLNAMYGAVFGRVRELAALQTMGFARRAIVISLVQESTLLATTGSLFASCLALWLVHGAAIRFTMGAFLLQIDSLAVAMGCTTGLLLGLLGALPPAVHALRIPLVDALKAV